MNNKKTIFNKRNIIYIIGFSILIFGIISTLLNTQNTKGMKKTIATINYITPEISNEKETIMYTISYYVAGEEIEYKREKKPFEDYKEEDMIFIYYDKTFPQKVIEPNKTLNFDKILILFGSGIIGTNMFFAFMTRDVKKEDKHIKETRNIDFSLKPELSKELEQELETIKIQPNDIVRSMEEIKEDYSKNELNTGAMTMNLNNKKTNDNYYGNSFYD